MHLINLIAILHKITSFSDSTYPMNKWMKAENMKEAANKISYLLPKSINLSTKLSAFLEECKIAKVKALFKKGSKVDPRN